MKYETFEELRVTADPVNDVLPLPVPKAMKDRYRRLGEELKTRRAKRINALARERLSEMLDELETLMQGASA